MKTRYLHTYLKGESSFFGATHRVLSPPLLIAAKTGSNHSGQVKDPPPSRASPPGIGKRYCKYNLYD
jgi:hypothetical protein